MAPRHEPFRPSAGFAFTPVNLMRLLALPPLLMLAFASANASPAASVLRCESGASLGSSPLAISTAVGPTPAAAASRDSSLLELFQSGQTFPDFLDAAKRRREGWLAITAGVRVDDAMVARARAVGGRWHVLVVAIDSCGDSMQQVPFAARLAELVPGLELRIVTPTQGAAVQAAHRSLDGRGTTPTYVLLDAEGRDVGCMVEFPRELREWNHARLDSLSSGKRHEYMAEWYKKNHGADVVREIVEMMEAAKAGSPVCMRGEG